MAVSILYGGETCSDEFTTEQFPIRSPIYPTPRRHLCNLDCPVCVLGVEVSSLESQVLSATHEVSKLWNYKTFAWGGPKKTLYEGYETFTYT